MKTITLDYIKEIKEEDENPCRVTVIYDDGSTYIIKGGIHIIRGLRNKDIDGPQVDHCI